MTDAAIAIANLQAQYCKTADGCAQDPDAGRAAFATIFTQNVVADYGHGPLVGAMAIAEFLCTAIAAHSLWMIHLLGSPSITLDGDHASGEWAVTVHSKRRESGEVMLVIGRYSNEFRLTPHGWRISKLTFTQLT